MRTFASPALPLWAAAASCLLSFRGARAGQLPPECGEPRCAAWPHLCPHVEYCIAECNMAEEMRSSCSAWAEQRAESERRRLEEQEKKVGEL
mmetsp:Transcript_104851/g.272838  ORF Transcript_104851/g.272838 Transcript_104851/m.272838 type:complete len:92 (-) Transcript_104851:27-302(-)